MGDIIVPLCKEYIAANRNGGVALDTQVLPDGSLWNAAGVTYVDPGALIPQSVARTFQGSAKPVPAVKGFTTEGGCR